MRPVRCNALWSLFVAAAVTTYSVNAAADEQDCPIRLSASNVTGHQILGTPVDARVTHSQGTIGMAPAAGWGCDHGSCCASFVQHEISVEYEKEGESHAYGVHRGPHGGGFVCTRWFPEVALDTDARELHLAAAGRCDVYDLDKHTQADTIFTALEHPPRRTTRVLGNDQDESPEQTDEQDDDFSRHWLEERTTSHVEYMGRVGHWCRLDVAIESLERLHGQLEELDDDGDETLLALIHTDLWRRSCALIHDEMMARSADHSRFIEQIGHHVRLFADLEESEQARLRNKIYDLGEVAARHGYHDTARRWARGMMVFDLGASQGDGFDFDADDAIALLKEDDRGSLAESYRHGFDDDDGPPEDAETYVQWLTHSLDKDHLAVAAGAYVLAEQAGDWTPDQRREVDTTIFVHLHDRVSDAWQRRDRHEIAHHLWLLDDWLLRDEHGAFFVGVPARSDTYNPHHSDFPFRDVSWDDEPDDDIFLLGEQTELQANPRVVLAVNDIAFIAHEMGKDRWFWLRTEPNDAGRPLVGDPNEMPVLARWYEEILRHDPERSVAHLNYADWYWHRAELERGFDSDELLDRQRDALEEGAADEFDCDEREERFGELQRALSEELIAEQNERRDRFREKARHHYRRYIKLHSERVGHENLVAGHIRSRLKPEPIRGCSPTAFITGRPPRTTGDDTARFELDCNLADCGLQCSLDGAAWSDCTSTEKFTDLEPGPHHLRVRAVDASGEFVSAPIRFDWTVE